MIDVKNAVLEEVFDPLLKVKGLRLFIKREDLIHPIVSGNKWRKLKYNLKVAQQENHHTLLTFGGAYSNHIHATAAAGAKFGFKTIGIIRGEQVFPLNPTLSFARENGMHLHFISRTAYRNKNTPDFIESLSAEFGGFYLIPEGGANELAIKGCQEIVGEIDIPFDYLCTSCGTGTTLAGLITGLGGKAQALGFSALKGDFMKNDVSKLLNQEFHNWSINTNYHFGGYAKVKPDLIDFINSFKRNHNIQLETIYTGKMMFGIFDLIKKGHFNKSSTIIALHTGGLQGLDGMRGKYGLT